MAEHLLVQISDIHLTLDGNLLPGVRPRENLIRALEVLDASAIKPDVFILTGDLADIGAGVCYEDLAHIFPRSAARAARMSSSSLGTTMIAGVSASPPRHRHVESADQSGALARWIANHQPRFHDSRPRCR